MRFILLFTVLFFAQCVEKQDLTQRNTEWIKGYWNEVLDLTEEHNTDCLIVSDTGNHIATFDSFMGYTGHYTYHFSEDTFNLIYHGLGNEDSLDNLKNFGIVNFFTRDSFVLKAFRGDTYYYSRTTKDSLNCPLD